MTNTKKDKEEKAADGMQFMAIRNIIKELMYKLKYRSPRQVFEHYPELGDLYYRALIRAPKVKATPMVTLTGCEGQEDE